jgi:hypothetical protein
MRRCNRPCRRGWAGPEDEYWKEIEQKQNEWFGLLLLMHESVERCNKRIISFSFSSSSTNFYLQHVTRIDFSTLQPPEQLNQRTITAHKSFFECK